MIATLESGLLTVDLAGPRDRRQPGGLHDPRHRRASTCSTDPDWWAGALAALRGRHAADAGRSAQRPARARCCGGEAVRDVTMLVTRPDGDVVTVSANYQPLRSGPERRVNGLVISITDVTEARRLQERVAHQALHDPLTGLPEPAAVPGAPRAGARAAAARPRGRAPARAGPLPRDQRHPRSRRRRRRADRGRDPPRSGRSTSSQPLARFGGDEFAVLAELRDERDAAALAQRLIGALERPVGPGVHVTAAIGIAVEDLAPRRRRPRPGRGRGAAARQGPRRRARSRSSTARWAAACATGCGSRTACAARSSATSCGSSTSRSWSSTRAGPSPSRRSCAGSTRSEGLLAPGRFLPVAEQHGRLISAIGDWVLRRACTEAAHWPPGMRVSINVAARELGEAGFAGAHRAHAAGSRTSPRSGSRSRSPRRR